MIPSGRHSNKRANGEGSIVSIGKDYWQVVVPTGAHYPNGRPKVAKRTVRGKRTAAEQRLGELLDQFGGAASTEGRMTLARVAKDWLAMVNPSRQDSTQYTAEKDIQLNIIDNPIGRVLIDKLDVEHVHRWQEGFKRAGQSYWTINTHRKHLGQILLWAEGLRLRRGSPLKFVPGPPKPESDKSAFTEEEAERFLLACQDEEEIYGPLFIVILMAGLRPGEATGLRWTSIDWEAGTITIDKALKRLATGRPTGIGTTKTGKTRSLRVDPRVIEALAHEQIRQDVARLSAGNLWPNQWDGLVFLGTDERRPRSLGRPPYSSNMRTQLERICATAGVPRMQSYELRHSRANALLARDVSPSKVADALGTSERMLRDHYHHPDPVIDVEP